MAHHFQSDNGRDECEDEKYAPKSSRFFEKEDTHQYRSNGANSCPNSISGTKG